MFDMDVAIRPPTCSLPVIFLGDLEETCILCFSRRFCSHVNCECVMSRSDSLFSSERSLEDVVFASASIQTAFPFRERSSRRLRALCLRISYFLLHSPFSLPPSVKSRPAGFARSIRLHVDRKFGGVTAAAGSGVFPRGTAWQGRAWQSMADRPSAVRHMAPFTQIPNTGEREWKVPRRGIHSRARRYDIFFSPALHLTRSWASLKIPGEVARGHCRVRKKTESLLRRK